MEYFPVECIADEHVFVRIKRFDGLFYNYHSQTFEDDPITNFDLVPGKGVDDLIWQAVPPIKLTHQFPPGRYVIYYYTGDGLRTAQIEHLPNENTPNEVASRVANIHVGDTSLRLVIDKMSKQIDEILMILKSNDNNTK